MFPTHAPHIAISIQEGRVPYCSAPSPLFHIVGHNYRLHRYTCIAGDSELQYLFANQHLGEYKSDTSIWGLVPCSVLNRWTTKALANTHENTNRILSTASLSGVSFPDTMGVGWRVHTGSKHKTIGETEVKGAQ
jgi:hypothetical protein